MKNKSTQRHALSSPSFSLCPSCVPQTVVACDEHVSSIVGLILGDWMSACCCRMSWDFQVPCGTWGCVWPHGSRNLQFDLAFEGLWEFLKSLLPHFPFVVVVGGGGHVRFP